MEKPAITTAPPTLAPRFEDSRAMRLPGPPEAVFELLCPVREYDWIPFWRCELLHSQSGAAERGCVFRTDFPGRGVETWICCRYEPPTAIEYVRFGDKGLLVHLRIALAAHRGGTRVLWTTATTATSEAGAALVADMTPERYAQEAKGIAQMLAHYLEHGNAVAPETSPLPPLGPADR